MTARASRRLALGLATACAVLAVLALITAVGVLRCLGSVCSYDFGVYLADFWNLHGGDVRYLVFGVWAGITAVAAGLGSFWLVLASQRATSLRPALVLACSAMFLAAAWVVTKDVVVTPVNQG
jgi:hypothetical protein